MEFLEKLEETMRLNKLNRRSLSMKSGIPYTTIVGWYQRGHDGIKLSTVRDLAEFFGTGLDYWAYDEPVEPPVPLTAQEQKVLQAYRGSPTMQPAVDRLLGVEGCDGN